MDRVISILTVTLCACASFVNAQAVAEEVPDSSIEIALEEQVAGIESPVADEDQQAGVDTQATDADVATDAQNTLKQKRKMRKTRSESFFDQFKIPEKKQRTCEQALTEMTKRGTVMIDFSNTSDFAENGETAMNAYYSKLIETKAFGTKSPNLYINLSKTGVSVEFISKWAETFTNDKRTVLWNLSDNPSVNDLAVDALGSALTNIYSLNLSNTSVTDAGLAKITASIEAFGIGNFAAITLTGSNVTEAGVASLRAAMQKALAEWKAKNPGKEYNIEGDGVIFKNRSAIKRSRSKKQRDVNLNIENESVPAIESLTTEEAKDALAEPEVSVEIPTTTDLSVEDVTTTAEDVTAEVPSTATPQIDTNLSSEDITKALNEVDEVIASVSTPQDTVGEETTTNTAEQSAEAAIAAADTALS